MSSIEPSLAGPKRPQDRVLLSEVDDQFNAELEHTYKKHNDPRVAVEGENYDVGNGDVVIAAITSCTNTSNPVGAGRRRPGRAEGARQGPAASKPWVKTSLAPGSKVVTDYLNASGLSEDLERARLRPRRLWLHHLHRQFRPARRADQQGDRRERSGRGQRALGQSQFRGPRVARLPRQLSRLAAFGGRLRAEGHGPRRPAGEPIGNGTQRRAGVPEGHLADQRRNPRADRRACPFGHVPQRAMPTSMRGDERWRAIEVARRRRPTPGRRSRPTSRTRPTSPA